MDIFRKGWLNLSGYAIHLLRLLQGFLTPNKDSAQVYIYKRQTSFLPRERDLALKMKHLPERREDAEKRVGGA